MFYFYEELSLIWGGIRGRSGSLEQPRGCTLVYLRSSCVDKTMFLSLWNNVGSQMVLYTFWLNGEMVKGLKYPLLVGPQAQHILTLHLVQVFQVNEKPTE